MNLLVFRCKSFSFFGLCAQKAFAFQLSEIRGCRPSLKLTTASGTFQEGLKALTAFTATSRAVPIPVPGPSLSSARHRPEFCTEGTLQEQEVGLGDP